MSVNSDGNIGKLCIQGDSLSVGNISFRIEGTIMPKELLDKLEEALQTGIMHDLSDPEKKLVLYMREIGITTLLDK